ncbi:glycerol-3-phosphate dehydrogenase/oxidase [Compostibacter hankyongensis]|uniref:Glycerol-3-phosphate dehydrogenase/oxidase n=1 Tax=Compostibacter hankyongensis TaxID=1007089 RepID=A0ABP8GB21_9BACT
MDRAQILEAIAAGKRSWDIIVIGGGATGLGVAVDAATRGLDVLLLEQADFAKGTSSRSTKLVHGGVRYLAQGDIKLVREALRERGRLLHNAPHLAWRSGFVVPAYSWWSKYYYGIGLKLYSWLSGRWGIGRARLLSRRRVTELLPTIRTEGLKGGIQYYDGQFDDARLAVNLAQTCLENGGHVLNYCRVTALTKDTAGRVNGVQLQDLEAGASYVLQAKAVVNATGVFVDEVLSMDNPEHRKMVRPSQGVHVVVDRSFLQSDQAVMIPKTSDGRVLFIVPWQGKALIGTTDTPLDHISLEPQALEEEIAFILDTAKSYLRRPVTRRDVLSIYAGLRPLAAPQGEGSATKEISRGHKLIVNASGLVSIIGGKWTTYRQMAEDTVDKVLAVHGMPPRPCVTQDLHIHGYHTGAPDPEFLYGADGPQVKALAENGPAAWRQPLHPRLPQIGAEVIWAVREEMARTVEDVLARRTRALFTDAQAAIEAAPAVAELMAGELHRDEPWRRQQVADFRKVAEQYLPAGGGR